MKFSKKIFGVLNITEDSFFDGKKYLDPEKAIQQAHLLKEQGADIIDIGAASSHPDSKSVSSKTVNRLSKIIPCLKKAGFSLSVDSFQPEVQLFAMEQGVDFLNDVAGFANPEIYKTLAKNSCRLIVMHSIQRKGKADRRNASYDTIMDKLLEFFTSRQIARGGYIKAFLRVFLFFANPATEFYKFLLNIIENLLLVPSQRVALQAEKNLQKEKNPLFLNRG